MKGPDMRALAAWAHETLKHPGRAGDIFQAEAA